jgi:AAA15 family ATPase/GTPase
MLLEFRCKNYKSFGDELVFSMAPAPKQKGLDYSVINIQAGKKKYKGLCSSVIYGPNASGKTNIIGAMETFKAIVLRGNIRNNADSTTQNVAAGTLEFIPCIAVEIPQPIEFSVSFIEEGTLFDYAFSADIGGFLAIGYKRKILSETLKINDNLIFSRDEELNISPIDTIKSFLVNAFEQNEESAIALARNNISDDELFLMNGFKTMFSSKLVALIANWLDKKFMVIYRADSVHLVQKFSETRKTSIYIEKTVNEAAKCFGVNSNDLKYFFDNESDEAMFCSSINTSKVHYSIPADFY